MGKTRVLRIGICSIGSGVGHAVSDACSLAEVNLIRIGFGNYALAPSIFDCHEASLIPSFYSPEYIPKLIQAAQNHRIDLIIPGHDDESILLAENLDRFRANGIKVLVPELQFLKLCRDKLSYATAFRECKNLFLSTLSLASAKDLAEKNQLQFPVIAKPLSGFASKEIYIISEKSELSGLSLNHIVQEIAAPETNDPDHDDFQKAIESGRNLQVAEVSIQLLFDKNSNLATYCATKNNLNNGIPVSAIPIENEVIDQTISELHPELSRKRATGAVNVQGRITNEGFKIFEINARFTGITGLRAAMGFNEVEELILHHVLNQPIRKISFNKNKIGLRSVRHRVISPDDWRLIGNWKPPINTTLGLQKTILITGSTGVLGTALRQALGFNSDWTLWTLDRSKRDPKTLQHSQQFDWQDLDTGHLDLRRVNLIVHLGSARPWDSTYEIGVSMTRTASLFTKFAKVGNGTIIFASSQSIYQATMTGSWTEEHEIDPASSYSAHKYGLEMLLKGIIETNSNVRGCVLRIAGLTGESSSDFSNDLIHKLIGDALTTSSINIYGGSQLVSRLHYKDAVDGIIKCVNHQFKDGLQTFNLTHNDAMTLESIALLIQQQFSAHQRNVTLNYQPISSEKIKSFAPKSHKFMEEFSWEPKYRIIEIVSSIIESRLAQST